MPNKRKCKNKQCGKFFRPDTLMDYPRQEWCCEECKAEIAIQHLRKNQERRRKAIEKAQRQQARQHRRQKREFYANDIKTRREAAVRWFNKFIRLRDRNQTCISCGESLSVSKYDAGHFITAGSCAALRFDERNCYGQCVRCNHWLSGNRVAYRERLIERFGRGLVDFLEGPQPAINRKPADYKAIEEAFKAKCKELEKQAA